MSGEHLNSPVNWLTLYVSSAILDFMDGGSPGTVLPPSISYQHSSQISLYLRQGVENTAFKKQATESTPAIYLTFSFKPEYEGKSCEKMDITDLHAVQIR